MVGSGSETAAYALVAARRVWWAETGAGFRPGLLAAQLAPVVGGATLVILPASPDGRDLAPRLAARLGRPLLDGAVSAGCAADPKGGAGGGVRATVSRLDDRVLMDAEVDGPAVVTLVPGSRAVGSPEPEAAVVVEALGPPEPSSVAAEGNGPLDPEVMAILQPDLHTMDLAEATRVVAGGRAGRGLRTTSAPFRCSTYWWKWRRRWGDRPGPPGWPPMPDGPATNARSAPPASPSIRTSTSPWACRVPPNTSGGLGTPRHIVSVNTDPSSPMTAMADLGLVTDAQGLLVELARRFGVDPPDELASRLPTSRSESTGG